MIFNKHIINRISTLSIALSLLTANVFVDADTMRQYQLEKNDKGYQMKLSTVEVPAIADDEIHVKVHVTSLNRRDSTMYEGYARGNDLQGLVPLSDGAGEKLQLSALVPKTRPNYEECLGHIVVRASVMGVTPMTQTLTGLESFCGPNKPTH